MSRVLIFLYGMVSYAVGMAGLAGFILYLGGWEFLPFHVDSKAPGPLGPALAINAGLMLLLTIQHSGMARPRFKQASQRMIPRAAQRSTYVLLSGLLFLLICFAWKPVAGTVWSIENMAIRNVITTIQLLGWGLVVASSFEINHFDLFGLQQVYLHAVGKEEPAPQFTERFLYRFVRHPLQLGVLIGIWCTATMSMTHLLLSVSMTAYILLGLYFEERDLVDALGDDYQDYRRRVPMLLPIPRFGSR